jgi:hypothetical protein
VMADESIDAKNQNVFQMNLIVSGERDRLMR